MPKEPIALVSAQPTEEEDQEEGVVVAIEGAAVADIVQDIIHMVLYSTL